MSRFLHENGCDIHSTNTFGCNAVLWSAQGLGNENIFAWLHEEVGMDFSTVNANGHSALHKAAQRGSETAVKWLANKFLHDETVARVMLCPDKEGNCPSDLCGVEGREDELAHWISQQECDFIIRSIGNAASINLTSSCIPSWLKEVLLEAKACSTLHMNDEDTAWGPGCGVRRIAFNLIRHLTNPTSNKKVLRGSDAINNGYNEID